MLSWRRVSGFFESNRQKPAYPFKTDLPGYLKYRRAGRKSLRFFEDEGGAEAVTYPPAPCRHHALQACLIFAIDLLCPDWLDYPSW